MFKATDKPPSPNGYETNKIQSRESMRKCRIYLIYVDRKLDWWAMPPRDEAEADRSHSKWSTKRYRLKA